MTKEQTAEAIKVMQAYKLPHGWPPFWLMINFNK